MGLVTTAFITHPSCRLHQTGTSHPESPQRLDTLNDHLLARGLLDLLPHYEAPGASRQQLLRVHEAAYLDWLENRVPDEGLADIDPDTRIGPKSFEAALHAAGAVVLGADLVIGARHDNAFCSVRPPGHHASTGRAMGFCLFNNVAVGVAHALEAHGLERIVVFDFDVHHGNGTDLIFAPDSRVRVCSVFQSDLYPFGTGLSHSGAGVDLPLPMGCGGKAMREAVRGTLLPAMREFDPQMVFVSAGFDAHASDDVADLQYSDSDFDWLTRQVLGIAEEHASGRLISVLEGGYELESLGRCAATHIKILAGL